ncbi:TPA: hypothetical protein ACQJRY_002800 [Klebsiella pneumoniae]
MRELTNKSTSIACELAALLMVVEECEVDQVERENLSAWLDEYRINWRQAWSSRIQRGRSMDNFYTYRSKKDLLLLAQEVAALLSCAAYLATIRGEEERIHVMSLTGLAQRLSDELANSLDISTFSDHESQEARS